MTDPRKPTSAAGKELLRFSVFQLDCAEWRLFKRDIEVRLPKQAMTVLIALASCPGELVTRDRLRHLVWGEKRFVDFDAGLNHCLSNVRQALGDSASVPRFIETVPGEGYRFIADVEKVRPQPSAAHSNERRPQLDRLKLIVTPRVDRPEVVERVGIGGIKLDRSVVSPKSCVEVTRRRRGRLPNLQAANSFTRGS